MPDPLELQFDPVTADRTYIRWLGDRKQIEAQTKRGISDLRLREQSLTFRATARRRLRSFWNCGLQTGSGKKLDQRYACGKHISYVLG